MFANHELRIEVARCAMTCINNGLKTLRNMLQSEIEGEWINAPQNPLFIEFGKTYFAAGIQLREELAANFLEKNPMFKSTVQNIGELLALLLSVRTKDIMQLDTDTSDLQYANLIITFDQHIPRDVLLRLPFARVIEDQLISLSPVENLNVNEFPFEELLAWPHLRRGRRRNLTTMYIPFLVNRSPSAAAARR